MRGLALPFLLTALGAVAVAPSPAAAQDPAPDPAPPATVQPDPAPGPAPATTPPARAGARKATVQRVATVPISGSPPATWPVDWPTCTKSTRMKAVAIRSVRRARFCC